MGNVQAHLEVGAHDGLGDLEVKRAGPCNRVVVDVRVVGGGDHAVRAGGGGNHEGIKVEAHALPGAEAAHAVIGLAHLLQARRPGFDQGDDARLVDGGVQVGIKKVGVQVHVDLVAVIEGFHGGAQVA